MTTDVLEPLRRGLGLDGRPIPAHETVGLQMRDVSAGSSTARLLSGSALVDDVGAMLPGVLAILADTCCGTAVASRFTEPGPSLTAQMRVEFVRPVPVGTRWVDGRGEADVVDDEGGLARGELVDDRDELLAVTSMRALRPAHRPAPSRPPTLSAEPRLRTAAPQTLATLPVHALLGVEQRHATDGRAQWTFAPGHDIANSFGAVHGGVVGLIAHLVATDAQCSVLDAGEQLVPLDLVVNYYRAVAVGTAVVHAAAEVAHRGRRFVVAEGEIAAPDGRVAVRFSVGGQVRRAP